MFQPEETKRKIAQNLRYALNQLEPQLKKGIVDDDCLDLVWTMVRNYLPSRRMLKRMNVLSRESLRDNPYSEFGYTLDNAQLDVLRDAQYLLALKLHGICIDLTQMAEERLARDLAAMNTWWTSLDAKERRVAFEAIAAATGSRRPGSIVSRATGRKRLTLLAIGLNMVHEAERQGKRWRALSKKDQTQILQSVASYAGVSADKWWNSATITEKTAALKHMIDALERAKREEEDQKTGKSHVA